MDMAPAGGRMSGEIRWTPGEMRRDRELTAHCGRCRLQYLQQAHRRELACEYGN